jgi:hypothetical protein
VLFELVLLGVAGLCESAIRSFRVVPIWQFVFAKKV